MHEHPSAQDLITAVKHFIDETAGPGLTGHGRFHARIASNVLAIILRDMEQNQAASTAEGEHLGELLTADPNLGTAALNQVLCQKIASGAFTLETPGLLAHLKTTAIAQLNIDQPHYSGLKAALEGAE